MSDKDVDMPEYVWNYNNSWICIIQYIMQGHSTS